MADAQQNFDDISKPKQQESSDEAQQHQSGGGGNALQTISRVITILPCFPKRVPAPPTPNIDQVKSSFFFEFCKQK